MKIGLVIAEYRNKKNLSQKELANILDVNTSTIGLWETNKRFPSPESLVKIADYFNISMDTLFKEDRDYRIHIPDEKPSLSNDCKRLIDYYEKMNEESQEILMGEARKILREQRIEENNNMSSNKRTENTQKRA